MRHFLSFLSLLSLAHPGVKAQDEDFFNFGPDALSYLGAKQTCIESTGSSPIKRCFYTYIPECAGQNSPLVFDIHGYGSSPLLSTLYTGWITKANENCFVVVMPSGNIETSVTLLGENSACWAMPAGLSNANDADALPCCCFNPFGLTDADITDDTTFLRNVAVSVIQNVIPQESANGEREVPVSIDSKRIYMAGHSNGCIASIAMGTVHSDLVAAVCCHAGSAQASFPTSYQPTPMWIAHGSKDPDMLYDGITEYPGFPQYSLLSAHETHNVIAEANGCSKSTSTNFTNFEQSDNNVTRFISDSCINDATVELFTIDDVGHFPYFGFDEENIENGTVLTTVDTTQHAWDFCSQFSLEVEPELILTTPSSASLLFGKSTNVIQFGLFAVIWSLR